MTKPLPRMTVEGADVTILVRTTKRGGYRIKVTDHNGDALREMRIAASTAELLRAACREASGDPDFELIVGHIRHIDDHGARP